MHPESVLIVDDEPALAIALRARLEAAGYVVHHAINGLAGVEAAVLHDPDAIIMDVRLPDVEGFEACERIRALPGLGSVPVLFLSASAQEAARRRAREAGADEFLSKPYDAGDVIAAVERIIARAAPRRRRASDASDG